MANRKGKAEGKRCMNWNTYNESRSFEKTKGNSMTIPDEAPTVRQIMNNHTRGVPPSMRDPLYQFVDLDGIKVDDQGETDFAKMDIQDQLEYARRVENEIEAIRARIEGREAKFREAAEKEAEKKALKVLEQITAEEKSDDEKKVGESGT